MKIKSFECPKSIRNYEKKKYLERQTLGNESFVPSALQTSVLYCRLSDLWSPRAMAGRSAAMQGCPRTWLENPNYPYLCILTLVACYTGNFQMNSK